MHKIDDIDKITVVMVCGIKGFKYTNKRCRFYENI